MIFQRSRGWISFVPSRNIKNDFLNNQIVCQKVFEEIDRDESKDEDWEEVHTLYPDTYDFLISLENGLETMGHFPET